MKSVKTLAIINFLAFTATAIINQLAVVLPINGMTTGELADLYPNLFVPAGVTFSIWGVIYLFMLAYSVHQLFVAFQPSADDLYIRKIGPWFIISSAANCCWILAWHYIFTELSLIIMLILLFSLIMIYLRLDTIESHVSKITKWVVIPGFSLYLGWITVATIANITTVLVDWGWDGGPIGAATWAMIMMAIAIAMGVYFGVFRTNVTYVLVIIWAMFGIYLKRTSAIEREFGIILVSQIGMVICALSAALALYTRFSRIRQ